jgi:hypothetical protein
MVGGHVDVFNYIYERNPEFLPKRYRQQYNSKTADPLTWWSYEMIVRIYEIDPKLIRLETLYAHAIATDAKFLQLLVHLHSVTQDRAYLPTDDELHGLPAKFGRWASEQEPISP